jgi:hypothetical protein
MKWLDEDDWTAIGLIAAILVIWVPIIWKAL